MNNILCDEDITVNIGVAKNKEEYMYLTINNKDILLNSKYNPTSEAKKWVEDIEIHKYKYIILFGYENGYRTREILDTNKDIKVIVIEPSNKIISKVKENFQCNKMLRNPNLVLTSYDKFEQVIDENIEWFETNSVFICSVPSYEKLFKNQYLYFIKKIKQIFRNKGIARNTILHFSTIWQENVIKNIPSIINSQDTSKLKGMFKDNPVIIVSAGPSLNKNIKDLKKAKGKSVILCVGTALKALISNNITPDFIISIDAGYPNYEHFKDGNYQDIPFIYNPKLNFNILKRHKGLKFLIHNEYGATDNIIKQFGGKSIMIGCGGSVSNVALEFAKYIGGNPVILTGQDLAYTEDVTHAKGTVYDSNKISIVDEDKRYVKDVYGKDILTDDVLLSFLYWFEEEIKKYSDDSLFIDATEGGANIEGTIIKSLKDTIDTYCREQVDIDVKLKKVLEDEELKLDKAKSAVCTIKKIQSEIKIVKEKIKKVLLEENNLKDNLKYQYFIEIRNQICCIDIINYMFQAIFYKFENSQKQDKDRKLFYQDSLEAIDLIESLIKDTLNQLKEDIQLWN